MDLDTMRGRVRTDLRDPAAERWDDATLDRHIARALAEVSLAAPRELTDTIEATGGREVDLATLEEGAARVAVEAVEYPTGHYPASFAPFSIWGDTLTLEVDAAPAEGAPVIVRYSAAHRLDAEGTTLPEALHDLVATGAAGYAAIEWASYATNRVNVGGDDVWRRYLAWGQDRLASFARALAKHGRERRLRSRRLYVAAAAGLGRRD